MTFHNPVYDPLQALYERLEGSDDARLHPADRQAVESLHYFHSESYDRAVRDAWRDLRDDSSSPEVVAFPRGAGVDVSPPAPAPIRIADEQDEYLLQVEEWESRDE